MGTKENFLTVRNPEKPFVMEVHPEMLVSRAVRRVIKPGFEEKCDGCGDDMRFRGNPQSIALYGRNIVILCNVFVDTVWVGNEFYHEGCYDDANLPYGPVLNDPPVEPTPAKYRANQRPPREPEVLVDAEFQEHEIVVDAIEILSEE